MQVALQQPSSRGRLHRMADHDLNHTADPRRTYGTIAAARFHNELVYGPPSTARDDAADMGAVFCENCHGTYTPLSGYVREGHQCLTDGTDDAYVLT